MRRAWLALSAALLGWAVSGTAAARPLEATDVSAQKVRIDGMLREWPKQFDALSENIRGAAGGATSARGVICYDASNVYVAMDVKDSKLVRTPGFGAQEDHAELLLAFPSGRGMNTYRVQLYVGVPGKSAGAVKLAGKGPVKGAKIVEAAADGGHVFEAAIPWSTFREAARLRTGMRAALRYYDADAPGSVKRIIATSKAEAGPSLPALLTEGEVGLYETLTRKNLPEKPTHMAIGDIAGDKMQEVVAVYGPFLTVVGAGYRGGKEFFFQDLGVGSGSAVRRFEVRDLTGSGKDDILLVKRVGSAEAYREILQVLSVSPGAEAPFPAFEHETAVVTRDLRIENEVKIVQKGGKMQLVVEQGTSDGVDPGTYEEPL
jgi:hypothetical protein